jgi:outer membrane protein TolC
VIGCVACYTRLHPRAAYFNELLWSVHMLHRDQNGSDITATFACLVPPAYRCALLVALLLPLVSAPAAAELTLQAAAQLALENDLGAARFEALAEARQQQAVADGQLPDPKLKLGAANFPIDSFDRSQEPMTQMQVGIQQAFPPGDTLDLSSKRTTLMAQAEQARASAMRREVLRDVRERYLEVWYQIQAGLVIDASRDLFEQLVAATRSHYAAGRNNQQDVLRANVELALLEDRHTRVRTDEDKMRADLARLIGADHADAALVSTLPELPAPPPRAELVAQINEHPLLLADGISIEAEQRSVDIARQRYKPGWMLDVTYGDRTGENPDGSERDDFLSAMVTLDLPLFTGKRQDRLLATRQQEVEAVRLKRDDQYRRLLRQLDTDYAEWQRLGERLQLYRDTIVPQAAQNARAAVDAYQSGLTDFSGVMRSRITELDVRLQDLRIRVDRIRATARLLYLAASPDDDVAASKGDPQ